MTWIELYRKALGMRLSDTALIIYVYLLSFSGDGPVRHSLSRIAKETRKRPQSVDTAIGSLAASGLIRQGNKNEYIVVGISPSAHFLFADEPKPDASLGAPEPGGNSAPRRIMPAVPKKTIEQFVDKLARTFHHGKPTIQEQLNCESFAHEMVAAKGPEVVDQFEDKIAAYRKEFDGCALTLRAFIRHWDTLGNGPRSESREKSKSRFQELMALGEEDKDCPF